MIWYKVQIIFEDDEYYDEIRGIDEADALKNAYDNWEQAISIDLIKD